MAGDAAAEALEAEEGLPVAPGGAPVAPDGPDRWTAIDITK